MARKRSQSRNERNLPRKRYTPGLGRDSITPGRSAKFMPTQECSTRGCENPAVVSKPRPDAPHTYQHLCTKCAGLSKEET